MKKFALVFALITLVSVYVTAQPQLTFRFANYEVINAGAQLQFDVEVKASVAGSYHRDLQIYFDYNTAGFGSNIVANGYVTVTPLTLMNTHYVVVNSADNTSSKFAVITEAIEEMDEPGSATYFNAVTTSFQGLLRFTLDIMDNTQVAGIAFDEALMNGGQYYQSTSNTDPIKYADPSAYDNSYLTSKLSTLYGTITYANAGSTPLNNCTVSLYLGAVLQGTDNTNASGIYGFSGIADGAYTLQTTCSLPRTGFNIADAFQLRQYLSTGAPALTPLQIKAGDVSWDGFTNIVDAFYMRQKLAGGAVPQWIAPNYVFLVQNATVASGLGMQNYQGLCSGDVNGSGTP
jgi:hypothetical protein